MREFDETVLSQSSDGALLELYTPVGAQITVNGEDIYVSQVKPASSSTTRLHVVTASKRRRTMRRRGLLQSGDSESGPEARATMDCGSGEQK